MWLNLYSKVCCQELLGLNFNTLVAHVFKDVNSFWTGKNPTDQYLDEMMNCAPGPINFTMFLTMFGEKLNGTDPEDVIKNAFACFDEDASGILVFCSWFNLVKIIDVCLLSVRNVSFEFL